MMLLWLLTLLLQPALFRRVVDHDTLSRATAQPEEQGERGSENDVSPCALTQQ